MLAVDPPFALVAADQQYTLQGYDGNAWVDVSRGLHCKVYAHPSLALVVASAGIAAVRTETSPITVQEVVADALSTPFRGPLNEAVVPRLAEKLEPLVREELARDIYDSEPDERSLVTLLIGISMSGTAAGAIGRYGHPRSGCGRS
jgi:hypothetical protein